MLPCLDAVDRKCKSAFTLRELRTAKGLKQEQLAKVLGISRSMYHSIECGRRRPTIDTLARLAAIYGTSMDFMYHSYYRQSYIWHFPDSDLKAARQEADAKDTAFLLENAPIKPRRFIVPKWLRERMNKAPKENTGTGPA